MSPILTLDSKTEQFTGDRAKDANVSFETEISRGVRGARSLVVHYCIRKQTGGTLRVFGASPFLILHSTFGDKFESLLYPPKLLRFLPSPQPSPRGRGGWPRSVFAILGM